MDANQLAAAMFPSMTQDAPTTPTPATPAGPPKDGEGWLDRMAKERKDDNETPTNKAAPGDKPQVKDTNPVTEAQAAETIQTVAKDMGFEVGELAPGVAKFVADSKMAPEQVKNLMETHNAQMKHVADMQAAQWREQSTSEFNSYQIDAAKSLIRQHGDAELNALLNGGIGNNPAILRFLSKVALSRR